MDETDVIDSADAPLPDEPQAPPPEEGKGKEGEDAATAEEAEEQEDGDAEEDGETEEEEPEKPKRRRPGKYQRQIMRLQAQNEALEGTVRALLQRVAGGSEPARSEAPTTAQAPREEDYQDREEYLVAKAAYEAEQKILRTIQARQRQQIEAQQRTQQAELARTYNERAEAAREKYEDFDDVAHNPEVPISSHMANVIAESEVGPDIAYYLGSHLAEARRIASLPPLAQARELGKIEAKLSAPPPKKTTSAPPPPKALGKSATVEKDPSKMTIEEYRAWRGLK